MYNPNIQRRKRVRLINQNLPAVEALRAKKTQADNQINRVLKTPTSRKSMSLSAGKVLGPPKKKPGIRYK